MRIAIFGLGSIGVRHAQNLLDMGEKQLRGFDTDGPFGDARKLVSGYIETTDAAGIWEWKPDAVLICTPPSTHYELARQALERGIHVFCEKPLCTDSWDADTLATTARNIQVQLAVGYQLRFALNKFHLEASERDFNFTVSQDMGDWPSLYQKDVLEEFSHEIDLAVLMNGPVQSVIATQYGPVWCISLQHQRYFSRITIHPKSEASLRFAQNADGQHWKFSKEENNQAYKDELSAFLLACNGAQWNYRLCSGAEAAHVVRIIEACRESARECSVVKL